MCTVACWLRKNRCGKQNSVLPSLWYTYWDKRTDESVKKIILHFGDNWVNTITLFIDHFAIRVHLWHINLRREQGWPRPESTGLPSTWPGVQFRPRRLMWVEFVVSLPYSNRFFQGTVFPPPSLEINTSWFDLIYSLLDLPVR